MDFENKWKGYVPETEIRPSSPRTSKNNSRFDLFVSNSQSDNYFSFYSSLSSFSHLVTAKTFFSCPEYIKQIFPKSKLSLFNLELLSESSFWYNYQLKWPAFALAFYTSNQSNEGISSVITFFFISISYRCEEDKNKSKR